MDYSQTLNGWFERKVFVKNGQDVETDVQQSATPYSSNNYFAQCEKINKFGVGSGAACISDV